jgi:tetratricopeptide (TPR) repeat protein
LTSLSGNRDFISQLPNNSCWDIWLKTAIIMQNDPDNIPEESLEFLLDCGPEYISFVKPKQPDNRKLALKAATNYPDEPFAWFWLAEANRPTDTTVALKAYLKLISLQPHHGLAWCRIGRIYESQEKFEEATNAYLECCKYDDPGSNGCYGAGRMMEILGSPLRAIEYYRLSHWDGAIERADELKNLTAK